MKTIIFDQITDSRFIENPEKEIDKIVSKLDIKLQKAGIDYEHTQKRKLYWDDDYQYRVSYSIIKTKEFTYKQLYGLVNTVKVVCYSIK